MSGTTDDAYLLLKARCEKLEGALRQSNEALRLYLEEDGDESRRLSAQGAGGSAAVWFVQHSQVLRKAARAALEGK